MHTISANTYNASFLATRALYASYINLGINHEEIILGLRCTTLTVSVILTLTVPLGPLIWTWRPQLGLLLGLAPFSIWI